MGPREEVYVQVRQNKMEDFVNVLKQTPEAIKIYPASTIIYPSRIFGITKNQYDRLIQDGKFKEGDTIYTTSFSPDGIKEKSVRKLEALLTISVPSKS